MDKCTSYLYKDMGLGFEIKNKVSFNLEKESDEGLYKGTIKLSSNVKKVRFDLEEKKYCLIKNFKIYLNGVSVDYENINGYTIDEYEIFLTPNPQIMFENSGTKIDIIFEKYSIDTDNDMILSLLPVLANREKQKVQNYNELYEKFTNANIILNETKAELARTLNLLHQAENKNNSNQAMYNSVINSTSWKLTKPFRFIIRTTKKAFRVCPLTRLPYKALHYWKLHGFKAMIVKIKSLNKRKKDLKNYKISNTLTEKERELQSNTKFSKNIKFSVVVPLYNTPENFLREMIQSVIDQTYGNWELCLANGSDDNHTYIEDICMEYSKNDSRIVYKNLTENLGISENTNAAIDMASGDYIALFDHDDLLHPAVLYYYMIEICDNNADFIYCDELTFQGNINNATTIHFKPDFAIDNLRAVNYICHFTVFSRKLLDLTGGFRKEFDGSQDHDMILRLTENAEKVSHVPKILYFWRSHPNSVAMDISSKTYAIDAGKNAVKEHIKRCGQNAEIESSRALPSTYRIKYDLTSTPLVSIIIPNKDCKDILKTCIDSIFELSTYENFEIIVVENNSVEKKTFEYYNALQTKKNIKVVYYRGDFNFSKINNFGFKYCKGEQIILLNNDIEVITPNWIEEMLMYNQRDDVGATGAMLYYDNDTIQHAGAIVGIGGVAGHSHKYFDRADLGYMGRLCYAQNLSAVTAACMMIKRSVFEELNGLDPLFKVAFNDIDLCMRIRQKGYLICWTPHAELYHHESISRGTEDTPEKQARFSGETNLFLDRWRKELEVGDPYYNSNLTLVHEDFSFK